MSIEQKLVQQSSLRQEQKQVLGARAIQAIEILQLATQDLEKLLENELVENPVLELASPESDQNTDSEDETKKEAPQESPDKTLSENLAPEDREQYERDLEMIERYNENLFDSYTKSTKSSLEKSQELRHEMLENTPSSGQTLHEYLLGQLRVLELDGDSQQAASIIIEALDENGHFKLPLEDALIAWRSREDFSTFSERALELVQSLDPPGIGARDTAEALLLQVDKHDQDYPLYHALLTQHWDDLLHNKLPKIAKEQSAYSLDDIKFGIEQIATLNPYPGRSFSRSAAQVIRPDIIIEEDPNKPFEYQVRMVHDYAPRVRISPFYRQLFEEAQDKETLDFVKQKIEKAKILIDALRQRESTLEKVAKVILEHQEEFMHQGLPGLKALKMQDVADKVGFHVSTISRTVADKYIETPQGTYPMKFFFVGGTESFGEGGEDTSKHMIKEHLKEIVHQEDKTQPLSDLEIGRRLSQKIGVKVARRTVAKYRGQLNIPDSRQRKSY